MCCFSRVGYRLDGFFWGIGFKVFVELGMGEYMGLGWRLVVLYGVGGRGVGLDLVYIFVGSIEEYVFCW